MGGYEMINRLIHRANWMRVKETGELQPAKGEQSASGPLFSLFTVISPLYDSKERRGAHQSAFRAGAPPVSSRVREQRV